MRVQRSGFAVLTLLLAFVPAAWAQECPPNGFIDAYRQAEAADARKDFAAAVAQFRPLAEQGLGPAQLRLGQLMAAGEGVPADPVAGYRWTALAADVDTPGAKAALAALEPRLSAPQRAQVKPRGWKPTLGPCLAVDPRIKRSDGTPGYDAQRLVNRVLRPRLASVAQPARRDWLVHALEGVRTKSPRYLIYLKSLYGVRFVDGTAPLIVVDVRENLPLLVINEEIATTSMEDGGNVLIGAAVYAVHKLLMPPVIAFETQSYKGRTIRFPATDDGRRFLAVMKQAIDMAENLPPALAKEARAVLDIRYEPREPYDKRGGAMAPGDIFRDPATKEIYLGYAENFDQRGPAHIVLNLTSADIRRRRRIEYEEAEQQLEAARERNATAEAAKAEQRMTEIKNLNTGVDKRGFCEFLNNGIQVMEALKFDPIEINAAYKVRFDRGCS